MYRVYIVDCGAAVDGGGWQHGKVQELRERKELSTEEAMASGCSWPSLKTRESLNLLANALHRRVSWLCRESMLWIYSFSLTPAWTSQRSMPSRVETGHYVLAISKCVASK